MASPNPERRLVLFGLRFVAGWAGSVLAGLALGLVLPGFEHAMFNPSRPAFQCLSVGALTAGVIALVRARQPGAALALALALGFHAFILSVPGGFPRAFFNGIFGLVLAGGIFLMATVYDGLAEAGFPVGKFLLTGPLLGGAYLAATPVSGLSGGPALEMVQTFWLNALLGLVIGDGVGFGVEMVELIAVQRGPRDGGAVPREPYA